MGLYRVIATTEMQTIGGKRHARLVAANWCGDELLTVHATRRHTRVRISANL
jgi:hypothetical protein